MRAIHVFLRDFWSDVVARLSGIASVVLAVVAASRKTPLPNAAFWLAAAVCFVVAAYRAWLIQYRAAAALNEKIERFARVSVSSPSLALLDIDRPSSDYATVDIYVKIPIGVSNPREVPTSITLINWHFEVPDSLTIHCLEFGEAIKHRKALSPAKSSVYSVDLDAGQHRDFMIDLLLNIPNRRLDLLDRFGGVLYFEDTFAGQLPPVPFSVNPNPPAQLTFRSVRQGEKY